MNLVELINEDDDAGVSTSGKTGRILSLMRARYPQARNETEALLLHFNQGQQSDRQDISRIDHEVDTIDNELDGDEVRIRRLEKEVADLKSETTTESADPSAMRELANLGRKLMDIAISTKDDELSNSISSVGDALTRFGTTLGPKDMAGLEKTTGLDERIILKIMELGNR